MPKERNSKSSGGKQGVRSDCYFELELKSSGGIKISLKSKVKSVYGESLKKQIEDICKFFSLNNVSVSLEDSGALPFVVAARLELAIKRLMPGIANEYLLPFSKKNNYKKAKDNLRRSRLYLPGNEPKYFINAGLHKPDVIIFDLEDSVALSEKDAAQLLTRNVLRSVNFYGSERMVRINQMPEGLDDLRFIVPHNIHVILIPKCESSKDVQKVDKEVRMLQKKFNIENEIYYIPIIESALGVIKAFEIVSSSKNVCALAIGLEDYTANIGAEKTNGGKESFFARSMVINAAKAAGVQALDSVFSDVSDMDGLKQNTLEAKSLGFEGKGCIHPRQIRIVHEVFASTSAEIEKAKKIVIAFEKAEKQGLAVVSLENKMIDPPVVKRALKTIDLAVMNELLPVEWRKNEIS